MTIQSINVGNVNILSISDCLMAVDACDFFPHKTVDAFRGFEGHVDDDWPGQRGNKRRFLPPGVSGQANPRRRRLRPFPRCGSGRSRWKPAQRNAAGWHRPGPPSTPWSSPTSTSTISAGCLPPCQTTPYVPPSPTPNTSSPRPTGTYYSHPTTHRKPKPQKTSTHPP